ncbi:hypothetical protein ACKWTF_015059 [Chironomus riparius]
MVNTTQKYFTNDDVLGFYAEDQVLHYFPKNLDKFFKNIELIRIMACGLKEVHQADFKPFRNLTLLQIRDNKIKIIEEGLFEFNQKLEVLVVYESHIIHIDPTVFDNLNNLKTFLFDNVPCINLGVYGLAKVREVIELSKKKCANSEFLLLDGEIKKLEAESRILSFEDFKDNLDSFGVGFKTSSFYGTRYLMDKYEGLMALKINQTESS